MNAHAEAWSFPDNLWDKTQTSSQRADAVWTCNIPNITPYSRVSSEEDLYQPTWKAALFQRMNELLDLKGNWDSYNAQPLRHDIAHSALELLESITTANTPVPSLVPTTTGGLQIEWHQNGIDLEIEVISPIQFELYLERDTEAGAIEQEFSNDFRGLPEYVALLSEID